MNKVKLTIKILFCFLSIFLVIKGQSIKSGIGMAIMTAGLLGLLLELFIYNRKYV